MEAVQIHLQGQGGGVSTQLVQMIPYVATLVVLGWSARLSRAPAALGQPWPPTR